MFHRFSEGTIVVINQNVPVAKRQYAGKIGIVAATDSSDIPYKIFVPGDGLITEWFRDSHLSPSTMAQQKTFQSRVEEEMENRKFRIGDRVRIKGDAEGDTTHGTAHLGKEALVTGYAFDVNKDYADFQDVWVSILGAADDEVQMEKDLELIARASYGDAPAPQAVEPAEPLDPVAPTIDRDAAKALYGQIVDVIRFNSLNAEHAKGSLQADALELALRNYLTLV